MEIFLSAMKRLSCPSVAGSRFAAQAFACSVLLAGRRLAGKELKLGPAPMAVTLLETPLATGRAQGIHSQLLQEISVTGALNLVNVTAKLLSNPSPCSYL